MHSTHWISILEQVTSMQNNNNEVDALYRWQTLSQDLYRMDWGGAENYQT